MPLYPLKFTPALSSKIWGGHHIREWYGTEAAHMENVGESWLLAQQGEQDTPVCNGSLRGKPLSQVLYEYGADLVGQMVYRVMGNTFPLLIKLIDADADLSIQVHPDDDTAWDRARSMGKTEMWYVMPDSTEEASVVLGFREDTDRDEILDAVASRRLPDMLNHYPVKAGDVAYVEAGQVHSIGKGCVVVEIQENSDVTYRLYDYDREDANGRKRELQLDDALDVLDYMQAETGLIDYEPQTDAAVELVDSPYFTTNLLALSSPVERDYAELDSFVAYLCVDGEADITAPEAGECTTEHLKKGELLLLPACLKQAEILPLHDAKLLEVYIG